MAAVVQDVWQYSDTKVRPDQGGLQDVRDHIKEYDMTLMLEKSQLSKEEVLGLGAKLQGCAFLLYKRVNVLEI